MHIKNVAEVLDEKGLTSPDFQFLNKNPDHIKLAFFQTVSTVEANASRVGPKDRSAMTEKMLAFFREIKEKDAHLATCPEYSCTWDAISEAINENTLPSFNRLWAIACESITIADLKSFVKSFSSKITFLFDEDILKGNGNFLNPLVYLFRSLDNKKSEIIIALIQFKTIPMADKAHFEYSHLIVGNTIYRFQNSQPDRLSLVSLLCSDSLDLNDEIQEQLRTETFILHLQLNDNPSADNFRSYRTNICNYKPRNTEILCVNWGKGTELEFNNETKPLINDPITALYRLPDDLVDSDERIHHNHEKGCFLAYWKKSQTCVFVFAPDEYCFYLETSKPYVEGVAQAARRVGPRMISLKKWNVETSTWVEVTHATDYFENYVTANAPTVLNILKNYWDHPLDAERLIQLSTGYSKNIGWYKWKELPSFDIENDDTSKRLSLGWSTKGDGQKFRTLLYGLFQGLNTILQDDTTYSARLATILEDGFQLTLDVNDTDKQFCNLKANNGTTGTAIYLGEYPPAELLHEVKKRTQLGLQRSGAQNPEALAIWYRHGDKRIDYMDQEIPKFNDDPESSPVSITRI